MKIKRRRLPGTGIQRSEDGRFGIDWDLGVVFEVVNGFEIFQDRQRWEAEFEKDRENPPPQIWAMWRRGSRKILRRGRFKTTLLERAKAK